MTITFDLGEIFQWVGILICLGVPVLALSVGFMYTVGKNAEGGR